ncbi:MAG: chorismate mutase [Candidatus Bathyarchaeia archaeon]
MSYEEEIEELREDINHINQEIIGALARRVEAAKKIGSVKDRHGYPVVDKSREEKVYKQVKRVGAEHGLDEQSIERIFREIIKLCTQAQVE